MASDNRRIRIQEEASPNRRCITIGGFSLPPLIVVLLLGALVSIARYRLESGPQGVLFVPSSAPSIGSIRIAPRDGMVMVYVPAGTFLMGSTDGDPFALDDEQPQRAVYLDAYWIDRTEVTHAMYAAFLNERGNQIEGGDTWLDADDPVVRLEYENETWQPVEGYADHPVAEVTWFGARAYCEWAGRRLPTEAEWEKAARGTDGRIYPWVEGNLGLLEVTCDQANFSGCGFDTQPARSHPGAASPYGALNMSGNLAEWVADWYDPDYYAGGPRVAPQGPPIGTHRVMRGGSWSSHVRYIRTASRKGSDPSFACLFHGEGFRCATSAR